MNTQEALNIITNACARFVGNLADHTAIQKALEHIKDAVLEEEKAKG